MGFFVVYIDVRQSLTLSVNAVLNHCSLIPAGICEDKNYMKHH